MILKNLILNINLMHRNYISSSAKFKSNNKKYLQKSGFRLAKLVVYAEIACFIGSYLVWKRMNDSQEFRFYMSNNFPTILEGI